METAWIISIGTELALGQTVDTNAAWLARRLAALGVRAERHVTVDDDQERIREALRQAARGADLVVTSGGLGPTDDDLTRPALAGAAGVKLQLHPASLEQIRAYFASREREMPERNRVQAMIPETGAAIPNACGTAPGVQITIQGTPCFALPGVPFEMRAMFDAHVAPAVRPAAGGRVLCTRVVHTFGLGESDVGQRIADLMTRGRNPEVGTTAQLGVIGIRINAVGANAAAATQVLDATEAELRRRLADFVFGRDDDTLASVVGAGLVRRGETLAAAESCTGGLLAKELTDIPGSSRYFLGCAVTYDNAAKSALVNVDSTLIEAEGAVSEPVARAMAAGARHAFGSTWAVGITGVAGPAGGTEAKPVGLVYVGVATGDDVVARRFLFGDDAPRSVIRERAVRNTLNLLRRRLL